MDPMHYLVICSAAALAEMLAALCANLCAVECVCARARVSFARCMPKWSALLCFRPLLRAALLLYQR